MGKRVDFSSMFVPKKHTKMRRLETKEDRISELPDEILVSVLSFLTLKEAACTSVLSKHWVNLWTFTSRLDFSNKKLLDNIQGKESTWPNTQAYVGWVNHVLKLHKGTSLDVFRIAFPLGHSFQEDIQKWILEFALSRSVQNLELDLLRAFCDKHYVFPDISLLDHRYRGFRSLKSLRFKDVSVSGPVLQFFLHNCQFLEELTVHSSRILTGLEVSGPSLALKHLEVCYCSEMELIVVRDTNLVSLKVINAGALRLGKVPSLVHVNVGNTDWNLWADIVSRLSCCLSQLSRLTLVIDDTKLFQKYLKSQNFPQLIELNELVLDVCIVLNKSMLPCTPLIQAAPFLKRLVFKVNTISNARRIGKKYKPKARRCPLPKNLEVVEICGYSSTSSQLELVMCFLRNATALKKIIIDPRRHDCSYTLWKVDESTLRNLAKQQLQRLVVPPHVELVVL